MQTVCDSYSGGCVDAPTPVPSVQVSTPAPESLPNTGFTYGDVVLLALLLIVIGLMALGLTRHSKA